HLLGKKSWNVYNQDNIEKVKRDEADAAAREAVEEQRMQEADAERRIHLLRGLQPDPASVEPSLNEQTPQHDTSHKRERKRRKLAGEDDTDRDLRFAKEDQATAVPKKDLQLTSKKSSDAPLMDRRGHIDLFPMEGSRHNAPKNAEVEAEKAKKKKEFEDQYTMRFSNAAGFKHSIGDKPWYQFTGGPSESTNEVPPKDVWGNEDPRRKEREKMRVAADDPMATIQKGVSQLRQVERERKQWVQEKQRETEELAELQRRRKRKSKKNHDDEAIQGLNLDMPADAHDHDDNYRSRHRHHHQHRHKHSSRSNEDGQKKFIPEVSKSDQHHKQRHDKVRTSAAASDTGWKPGSGGRYSNQFAHTVS
ncbi:MAG: hypothetical protein Q9209_000149, partial [Squamulea sp. 1 TL-2023]